jgi:hypothetical protein
MKKRKPSRRNPIAKAVTRIAPKTVPPKKGKKAPYKRLGAKGVKKLETPMP